MSVESIAEAPVRAYAVKHNFVKRAFDTCFTLAVLLLFCPLFVGIACAVKLSSPGPALYSSLRVGRGGKRIRCWKFRTMCVNADAKLREMLQSDEALRREWETFYKLKNDPRITPIGRFLRKTSLDELPQFWNVLRGDLSVVGPRPVTEAEVETYLRDKAAKILSVRPGLTGLWQTSGRNLLPFEERVRLEERYVDERSFLMDLRLIGKTIPALFSSRGAF
jgi:undecaprenyl-phosphate galactose phosphotransferase